MREIKNFGLIGAAGYIAPRHMIAIRDTGNQLTAALDPSDSVGIMDSYFPDADFFTEFERFDRHVHKLKRNGNALNIISICSPNYLHDSHIRFAVRSGCDAICEKPIVLNPHNIVGLKDIEDETGCKINTILQLRVHPSIIELRRKLAAESNPVKYKVNLTYITSRGRWYLQSWKGFNEKSGGIATNIGVHFFDMLHYLFGKVEANMVHLKTPTRASGSIEYERASVSWYLSLEFDDVPKAQKALGQRTHRSITIDGDEIEFSGGFTDLHTRSYEQILAGNGFGLDENMCAISTVSEIRLAEISKSGNKHPFLVAP
tara:strand:- start:351 stop:1298 length:948 start_codon:yes stop_codon:yes gene_type:complete